MPEGDTLRRLATKIDRRFAGATVERSTMRDPRLAGADLSGCVLVAADAYGKHLFVRFDDGRTLHAHLLMTGSFTVGPRSTESEWRRRVELRFADGWLTGEAVPVLGLLATDAEHTVTDHLGPDLCAVDGPPDPDLVATRMLTEPDAPVGGAMLDQRRVAGFGNVYANDVPFVAGVHPAQPVSTVRGLADLVAIGTAMIRVNAERGVQNTTGRRLGTDARWVHGVGPRPCPVCGTRLERWGERESPWGRATTWCPACQPGREKGVVDLERVHRLVGLHPAVKLPIFPRRPDGDRAQIRR